MRGTLRTQPETVHWQHMADWFPRGITPTDFDLFVASPCSYLVEMNHRFLLFEFKHDTAPIPRGQGLALQRLVTQRFTNQDRFYLVRHNATNKDITPDNITTWHCYQGGTEDRTMAGHGSGQLHNAVTTWVQA